MISACALKQSDSRVSFGAFALCVRAAGSVKRGVRELAGVGISVQRYGRMLTIMRLGSPALPAEGSTVLAQGRP